MKVLEVSFNKFIGLQTSPVLRLKKLLERKRVIIKNI